MSTLGQDLVAFLYTDLVAVTRGRLIPATAVDRHLQCGLGWVPANQAIDAFDVLAEPNPWGSVGDLRIVPDPSTRVRVDLWPDATPLEFLLCDALETDGRAWDCCPRTLLRDALADLHRETGLRLLASFEHEFTRCTAERAAPSFSLRAHRRAVPFGELVVGALQQAGAEPECFLPEYGAHQFEITCAPAEGLVAADRAIVVREVVHEVARWLDAPVTFAPLTAPDGMANGVHLHFSLIDGEGRGACHDDARPGQLSLTAARFAAGVLAHLPALTAVSAPTPPSRWRLAPHRWSAGIAALGFRNREATLRIAPTVGFGDADRNRQVHLEFRALDATASPYLTLALLIRAGMRGVCEELPSPPLLDRDPETLSPDERAALGPARLPADVDAALAALAADGAVRGWLGERLYECFALVRRSELEQLRGLDPVEVCRRYAAVY